jgi:serine/threonine-protein kinase
MLGDGVRRRLGRLGRMRAHATGSERRQLRTRLPAIAAALALPFAIGYLVAIFVVFPAPDVAAQGIPVPALVGLAVADAERQLAAASLGPLEVTPLPHPTVPEGTVTAQSPLPGQQLRAGSPVRAAVSSGVPRVMIPDLIGFPVERAASLLTRLGFQVQRVDRPSDTEAGRVLRLDPPPGTERALPSHVTVYVSAGRPPGVETDTVGLTGFRELEPGSLAFARCWTGPAVGSIFEWSQRVTLMPSELP